MDPAPPIYEAAIAQRPKGRTRRVKLMPTADDELRPDQDLVKDLVIRQPSDPAAGTDEFAY